MTDTPSARPRRPAFIPLLTGIVCILAGLLLLRPVPESTPRPAHARPPTGSASPAPAAPRSSERPGGAPGNADTAAGDTERQLDGLPVSGDGPEGDRAIQRLLEQTSPANLPRHQEKQLTALAARVWRAEVTGQGRQEWPAYFADRELRAPFGKVRIQAAVARAVDDRPDRVRVRLVWAGAPPAQETVEDGRPGEVVLARRGDGWEPVR